MLFPIAGAMLLGLANIALAGAQQVPLSDGKKYSSPRQIPGGSQFEHCSDDRSKDIFQIETITMTPGVRGFMPVLKFKVNGTFTDKVLSDAKIRDRTYVAAVDYEEDEELPFCEAWRMIETDDGMVDCPLGTGHADLYVDLMVPWRPEMYPNVTFEAVTGDNRRIYCVTAYIVDNPWCPGDFGCEDE